MQLHLDPVGGMAGDMFVAALLDAFPEHELGTLAAVAAVGGPVCRLVAHNDGVLQGRRFVVEVPENAARPAPHHHHHDHEVSHHGHRAWASIRDDLRRAPLGEAARGHALAIFGHLAEAEARVHGIEVERVQFHEVGAWDSIADIVAAAHLAAALDAARWTVGPLPLGSGRVSTAHGALPVPAPATALLLRGFATLDDGVPGERVTPTGAAILRHLCEAQAAAWTGTTRTLGRAGYGFGARRLPGMSNCVRVLAFDEAGAETTGGTHRELVVIEFEVDDQSAEDLATGLDRLRAHPDVFDVVQAPVFGKKGRMMTHVRALARVAALDSAIEACFRETTTIGLRHRVVAGAALPRRLGQVEVEGRPVRVKTVERPGGATAKAEADDAVGEGHAARARLRQRAEALALEDEA